MIITVFYFQEKKNCDMKLLYQPKVHKRNSQWNKKTTLSRIIKKEFPKFIVPEATTLSKM